MNNRRTLVLAGHAIGLAEMTEQDQVAFQQWLASNAELRALIDDPSVPTPESQKRWFERSRQPDRRIFSILTLPEQALIGNAGIVEIDTERKMGQLRITIGEAEARGKGYGTEVIRLLLQHAFTTLALRTVYLRVLRSNARAVRTYEKAGFLPEEVVPARTGQEMVMAVHASTVSTIPS